MAQSEKGFNLSLSSGITMPIGDYQKYTKDGEIVDIGFPLEFYGYSKERTGKFQFNIDATYQFGSLGAGISYGQFTHEISTLKYDINLPTLIKGGDIKGNYYGLGPNYGFSLGKLGLVTSFRVGMMNLDIVDFKGSYNGDDTVEPVTIISTTINSEANETLMYSSFGVKLSYPVINNLNLFIKGDYFTTFGDGVKVDDNFYLPFDMDNNQEITIADVEHFTLIDYEKNESRYIKPQMLNIGVGITYTLEKRKVGRNPQTGEEIKITEQQEQDENGIIFNSSILEKRKENPVKNCLKVMQPSNGSSHNINDDLKINIKVNNGNSKKSINPIVKVYKVSDDNDYWNRKENLGLLKNTEDPTLFCQGFEKENKYLAKDGSTLAFVKEVKASSFKKDKANGNINTYIIKKNTLSEGSYKLVVINDCGASSSNFMLKSASCGSNDATVNVSCGDWVNGELTYTISVTFNNVSSSVQSCTTSMNNVTSSTGSINSVSTLPTIIPANGNSSTVTYTYTPNTIGATSADFFFTGIWNDGNSNTSNFHKIEDLPNCICDFCETALEMQSGNNPNATYDIRGNSLSIHQGWWNTNSSAGTIVGAKAEIISFQRKVSDECMKCNKDANLWGNFISGNLDQTNGSFADANNGVTGNTHHTLYFNEIETNPSAFDLNIAIPPLSTLKCCCERIKILIRYTYTFKDKNGECKMCSAVFKYSFQKGKCPMIIYIDDFNILDHLKFPDDQKKQP